MKTTHIQIILSLFAAGLCAAGCDGTLDRNYDDTLSEELVLNNREYAIGLQTAIYNFLPRSRAAFNCVGGAMLDCATDDGVNSDNSSSLVNMVNGGWSPSTLVDDQWGNLWQGVRKCNLFLSLADRTAIPNDEVLDVDGNRMEDSHLRDRLKAEAYFQRAFLYFELAKRFHDVPMITHVPGVNDNLDFPRAPFGEIIDSVAVWCDRAAAALPASYSDMTTGRATKGAALLLKSRALLYAASPLFNTSGDVEKWRAAAKAAKDVIDFNKDNGNVYRLVAFADVFLRQFTAEVVFAGQYGDSNAVETNNFPNGYTGGYGRTNPTQNLVDAFEIRVADKYVPYDPQNQQHVAKMYSSDRDPRLAATVLYNGAPFAGRNVQSYVGGLDGLNYREGYTKTGYYFKKFVDPSIDLTLGTTRRTGWIHFRYAEALLNYAEAQSMVEVNDDVYDCLNMVRERSMGSAGIIAKNSMNQTEMIEKVRCERRVEFAFEEFRFWDLRRWNEADAILNRPVYGIRFADSSAASGEIFKVEDRTFDVRMNFFPIPISEVRKSPATGQTPGWQ